MEPHTKIEKGWIDAHCHLSVSASSGKLFDEISAAKSENILNFFESAFFEEHVEWNLSNSIVGKVWCAGIHPYVDKNKIIKIETIENLINNNLIIAIGEIGLDKRSSNNIKEQKKILLTQLDFAKEFDLPVVIHVVGTHYDLYRILKKNFPHIRGYIHGFIGKSEIVNLYKDFNLGFMIGGKITSFEKYHSTINYIIKNKMFLFETDTPYQVPHYIDSEINRLVNLKKIIEKTCSIARITEGIVYNAQIRNFNNMFLN